MISRYTFDHILNRSILYKYDLQVYIWSHSEQIYPIHVWSPGIYSITFWTDLSYTSMISRYTFDHILNRSILYTYDLQVYIRSHSEQIYPIQVWSPGIHLITFWTDLSYTSMISRYTFDHILARSILYKYDLQVYIWSHSEQIYPIQVWSPGIHLITFWPHLSYTSMISRYTFDHILNRSILYKYDLQVYIRSHSEQIYPIQVWSPGIHLITFWLDLSYTSMISRYTFDHILNRSIIYTYDLQVYIRSHSGHIYPIQVWSPGIHSITFWLDLSLTSMFSR